MKGGENVMITLKLFGETMPTNDVEEGSGKGIHFLVNGWCLSAQAGWGNYCSEDPTRNHCKLTRNTTRTDCEIALWNIKDDDMIKLDGDTVMGWVEWDMVFDVIQWLRKQKEIPTGRKVRNKILYLRNKYNKEVKENENEGRRNAESK